MCFSTTLKICFLILLTCAFAQKASSAPEETNPVRTSAPDIEFQAQPIYESIGRDEPVVVFLFISNKSSVNLENLRLIVPDKTCEIVQFDPLPATLSSFESINAEVTIKMRSDAAFAQHKIPFTLQYAWKLDNAKEAVSAKSVIVSIKVSRRFDEEAKGFPGGTAAFLYLLLPVIPAILGYQFFENLRTEQGIQVPAFKTEYIVPAFFIAVLLNFSLILLFNQDKTLNYSDPQVFIGMLLISFILGAFLPLSRWLYALVKKWQWGFNNQDKDEIYLEKALLAPHSPANFRWVTGTAQGEQWTGLLLSQPDGKLAIGMRLQVTPAGMPTQPDYKENWSKLKKEIFKDNVLNDKQQLIAMIKSKKLILKPLEKIIRGGETIDALVVTDEVSDFKLSDNGSNKEIVEATS